MAYAQWNPQANYLQNDIVYDGALAYQAVVGNTAKQPSLNTPAIWSPLGGGGGAGVSSLNNQTGAVNLVAIGTMGVQAGVPAAGDISIGYKSVVNTLEGLDGDVKLQGTGAITITDAGQTITINAPVSPVQSPAIAYLYSTTTQTFLTPTEQKAFKYDVGQVVGNIQIPTFPDSVITIKQSGLYRIFFSIQTDKVSGGGATSELQAWVQVNGFPVDWSNSNTVINANIQSIVAVEVLANLVVDDTVEIIGYSNAGFIQAIAYPIDVSHPVAIPSIILSITFLAP